MSKTRLEPISIFFPAYNEAGNIRRTLNRAVKTLNPMGRDYELIVIDDGSTDRTVRIVTKMMRRDKHIYFISHKTNQGYGAAVRTGIKAARHDLIFYTDGDGQFELGELPRAIRLMRKYDAIIGYRRNRRDNWLRKINASAWKLGMWLVYGLKYRDIDCAFKLFRKKDIDKFKLTSNGAMISPELVLKLERQGCRIKEIPVRHLPRRYGRSTGASMAVVWRALTEMIRMFPRIAPESRRQLIKFIIVGVSNVAIDTILYFILSRLVFPANLYLWARVISYGTAIFNNFYWNRRWTFRSHEPRIARQFTLFTFTQLTLFALNMGLMYLAVSVFGWYDIYGVLLTILLASTAGFVANKYWIFRDAQSGAH